MLEAAPVTPTSGPAKKPGFDKVAYMREYMRRYRAKRAGPFSKEQE
jgi:hypothetical protein